MKYRWNTYENKQLLIDNVLLYEGGGVQLQEW